MHHITRDKSIRKAVTASSTCPVCAGKDGCSTGNDGLLMCRRQSGPQPGYVYLNQAQGDPQFALYRAEDDPVLERRNEEWQSTHHKTTKPNTNSYGQASDWATRNDKYVRALTPALRGELAQTLGLPEAVLPRLDVGWSERDQAWTFPERDAAGRIVGILRRPRDHSATKKIMAGGKHGIYIPTDLHPPETIYVPEGASDVLSLLALGLPAIGRPSNLAGTDIVFDFVKSLARKPRIVVLAEMDANDKGEWPGRDGAIKTAGVLQARLGKDYSVQWVLPPAGSKDVRAWVRSQNLDSTSMDSWHDAGQRFEGDLIGRLAAAPTNNQEEVEKKDPAISFVRLSTADFFAQDYSVEYLIQDVMVRGQPLVIAGGKKNLKTNLMVAASLHLASGTQFLGKFPIPRPVNVGIMSGESGAGVIQETGRRIASANRIDADQLGDRLRWCFDLPKLGSPIHMDALRRFIEEDELEVLFIDPAYLCIPVGNDAGNLFAMGQYLSPLSELGQKTNCTAGLATHTRKNPVDPFAPPELEEIAWSGFQEWARQWIMLSRRERYDPELAGVHKLWMNTGGSAGHSSLWAIDIFEGGKNDLNGRRWEVQLEAPSFARSRASEAAKTKKDAEKRQEKERAVTEKSASIMRALQNIPGGTTKAELEKLTGMSGKTFGPPFQSLLDAKKVLPCQVRIPCGNGTREIPGFNLAAPRHPDSHTPTE